MSAEEVIENYQDIIRQYNILNQISKIVASNLNLNKILKIILNGVTFGDGFGFNRAFLFLIDKESKNLIGRMAIGPSSPEEAWRIWGNVQQKDYSLEEFLNSEKFDNKPTDSILDEKIRQIIIPFDYEKITWKCLEDGIPRNVNLSGAENNNLNTDTKKYVIDPDIVEKELREYIEYPKFCIIPLICRTKKVGILIVDNKFNKREITEDDIKFLLMLGQFVASSIRNTIMYDDLKDSLASLARLNMKLNHLKEYNERIIESIPVSILVIDNNFIVTSCNENCAKIMGVEKNFIIGKQISTHTVLMDGISLVEEIHRVMVDRKMLGFYKVNIYINDKKITDIFNIILVPFKFSEKNPDGVVIILENVTKTVKLEQALHEAQKLSQLGKLSATVAHEIRNPLIAIGGYANRLKRKYNEEREIDSGSLDTIIGEVSRLERIVNEILDFASERKVEFNEVNICSILLECIDLAQTAAELNNISIIFDCGKDLLEKDELFVYGSNDNLKQAFLNILNNAIDASEKRATVKICALLEEEENDSSIIFKVNNAETLKNMEDIYNIFLPFYTTKTRGTGLGLTITKRIIEQHSGNIEVESNLEKGTTFTIKLPLLKKF